MECQQGAPALLATAPRFSEIGADDIRLAWRVDERAHFIEPDSALDCGQRAPPAITACYGQQHPGTEKAAGRQETAPLYPAAPARPVVHRRLRSMRTGA